MCEIVKKYAKEVAEAAAKEAAEEAVREKEKAMAKKLFENGVDFQVVLRSAEKITAEELKEIYEDVNKNM